MNKFSVYFENKIEKLRNAGEPGSPTILHTPPRMNSTQLCHFDALSVEEMKDIFQKSKTKTSSLDPVPTIIVRNCLGKLGDTIRTIVNCSFRQANFPDSLKVAMILPCMKKVSLDLNELSNYRPIANLPFLSKIIEKATASQLEHYLVSRNSLHPLIQSGYRKYHSTETALIKLFNDIGCSLDDGHHAILILLDLSCAFDTIDHEILITRLQARFGITGNALLWLKSYLVGRRWFVSINGFQSDSHTARWGVPQGSVFAPYFLTYIFHQ